MKSKTLLYLVIISGIVLITSTLKAQQSEWSCTPIEVKTVDAVKALVIKTEVSMQEIGNSMAGLYGELFNYLQENNIQPAGAPFAVYLSWDPNGTVVFETGVPVANKLQGTERINYKQYPKMKVAATEYTGSYENMEPVYAKTQEYLAENSLESTGESWEVYLTDPEAVSDPKVNKTLIYFPVKD